MNFQEEYNKGQRGANKGLYMGDGLVSVSNHINGLQRARYYLLASAPKVGKSTFLNYGFIIQPYLYALEHNIKVKWTYFSLEMSRLDQEFNFATYFIYHDYGITHIDLPEGVTKNGESRIELNPDYIRGRILDDNREIIKTSKEIEDIMIQVYLNRIVPLFGEYSPSGIQIKEGLITFIDTSDNPTGIYNYLIAEGAKTGTYTKKMFGTKERIMSYTPDDPDEWRIVCFDHCRKLYRERGFDEKQTIDKLSEYFVILRNLLGWSFVNIIHLNRSLSNLERFKQFGDMLFPDSDMIKGSGNMAEDADYVFTLFNPNDERYNLKKHFDRVIKDKDGNELYPNLRTAHLVESRHCFYPKHFGLNMNGAVKDFKKLIE